MSYKFSKGSQVIGDLKAQDDTQRDTLIDFGEDQIEFQTSGSVRLQINNHRVSSSLGISGSAFYFADAIKIAGAPSGQDTVIDNQGNFFGNSIDVGTVSGSSIIITDNGSPVYQLPIADGDSGQVIITDGSGSLTFSNVSGASGNASQFFQGHVEIGTTAKPVNFHNVVSIGANDPKNIKSWFIAPFTGQINKVILSVKANNFSTSNHGTITVFIYKNQSNFNSATSIAVAADNFAQTVNNLGSSGNNDVNTGIFNTSVSIQEGDLIQIKVGKSVGGSEDIDDAIVTLRLTEQ